MVCRSEQIHLLGVDSNFQDFVPPEDRKLFTYMSQDIVGSKATICCNSDAMGPLRA